MATTSGWRPITVAETAVVDAVLAAHRTPDLARLAETSIGAEVRQVATWILDIRTDDTVAAVAGLADGLLPVRTHVHDTGGDYQGEILIWISGGRISGLEFAWVTDTAPTRWPTAAELSAATAN